MAEQEGPMTEISPYSQENMPMSDILSEIRDMVSREANARYADERKQTKREFLILRPEARVDLLLEEAEPDIELSPVAAAPEPQEDAEAFKEKLVAALGVSDKTALEALIRKVLLEEMTAFGG